MPPGRVPKGGRHGASVGRRRGLPGTDGADCQVVPKDARDRERVRVRGDQGRRSRGREAEQVLVQRQALFEAPFPDRRKSSGPMDK